MDQLRRLIFIIGYLLPVVLHVTGYNCNGQPSSILPRPDHVVMVIEENRRFSQIIDNPKAPYINSLARQAALFSQSFGTDHPSQPNYLALFSGDTQGTTDNFCPHTFRTDNLGSRLLSANLTFGSFSESMPSVGFAKCVSGPYARKHNPCANWQGANIPAAVNLPFTSFPTDFNKLPAVSLVIPNLLNDMHDGTVHEGDNWLKKNLDPYVRWAKTHNSLLIVTWDEDDGAGNNHIATIFVGPMVKSGIYSEHIDHYNVLRTILDMFGLAPLAKSATVLPISDVWLPSHTGGKK